MSYIERRKEFIEIAKRALDKGEPVPFQEGSCYDQELCAKVASIIENDFGTIDDATFDKSLAMIFGFLEYLKQEYKMEPVDTEYISQLILFAFIHEKEETARIVTRAAINEILGNQSED